MTEPLQTNKHAALLGKEKTCRGFSNEVRIEGGNNSACGGQDKEGGEVSSSSNLQQRSGGRARRTPYPLIKTQQKTAAEAAAWDTAAAVTEDARPSRFIQQQRNRDLIKSLRSSGSGGRARDTKVRRAFGRGLAVRGPAKCQRRRRAQQDRWRRGGSGWSSSIFPDHLL